MAFQHPMNTQAAAHDEHWIVVIGRSNFAKSSRSLEQLVGDLRSRGFAVHGFESSRAQLSLRMSGWFESLLDGSVAAFCHRHARWGKWLRKMTKAGWLLVHPSGWDFSRLRGMTHNERAARELQQLLRHWQCHWPLRRVHFLAHSAGGIVASWLESEPNVVSLVCFGYPFRHPQMPEESYRTAHLQKIRKPFLIIQGDQDEYGCADRARQYALSESIRVVTIQANHDYDDLPTELYQHCLELVGDHLESSARQHRPQT